MGRRRATPVDALLGTWPIILVHKRTAGAHRLCTWAFSAGSPCLAVRLHPVLPHDSSGLLISGLFPLPSICLLCLISATFPSSTFTPTAEPPLTSAEPCWCPSTQHGALFRFLVLLLHPNLPPPVLTEMGSGAVSVWQCFLLSGPLLLTCRYPSWSALPLSPTPLTGSRAAPPPASCGQGSAPSEAELGAPLLGLL